jgi:hypothetical protein
MATKREKRTKIPIPTQEEINRATVDALQLFVYRFENYIRNKDINDIKLKYEEHKPLKPLYTEEGGKPVGFIQEGPRVLSIVIEDFTADGDVKGLED